MIFSLKTPQVIELICGSVSYSAWLWPSSDSVYAARYGTTTYTLDFYDTAGNFVQPLDTLRITSALPHLSTGLRTVLVSRSTAARGFAALTRRTANLPTQYATWSRIVSHGRHSAGYKRASFIKQQQHVQTIAAEVIPNPFTDRTVIHFSIPAPGPVLISRHSTLRVVLPVLLRIRTTERANIRRYGPRRRFGPESILFGLPLTT